VRANYRDDAWSDQHRLIFLREFGAYEEPPLADRVKSNLARLSVNWARKGASRKVIRYRLPDQASYFPAQN
jgi:hypothetical protein